MKKIESILKPAINEFVKNASRPRMEPETPLIFGRIIDIVMVLNASQFRFTLVTGSCVLV